MTEYITKEHVLSNLANMPQLVFEVTDACNLKCKYCAYGEFYGDFDKRENKMLPVSQAIRLIDYLNQYWNSERNTSAHSFMYISFFGGDGCTCGCAYSNHGGSSTSDNAYANYERGYQSRNSCNIIELSGEGWQAIGRPKAK